MAVTTTYSFDFVQFTDLTEGPTTSQADATSLTDGGLAVSGSYSGATVLDFFDLDVASTGGAYPLSGANSAIDQLANGNIVVASQDADSILYGILNIKGQFIVSTTDINNTGTSNPDVAELDDGGFVIVSQDFYSGSDYDIDVRVRDAGGGVVSSFAIDVSTATDTDAAVCGLDDGGFAVAWQRTVYNTLTGLDNTEIWYAVYEADGTPRKAAALFDTAGSINRNADIAATSGGFALVYEDDGWGTGTTDITLAQFNSAGSSKGVSNISNPALANDGSHDANPAVTRLSNGLLAVGYENNSFADTDGILTLFDANANKVLLTSNITGGEALADDVGDLTIAGSAFGRVTAFQTNFTDGDVDGETLAGRRTSVGDAADDDINGDDFIDVMSGGGGADALFGWANDDILNGGGGADYLRGDIGADKMRGQAGGDAFFVGAGDIASGELIDGGGGKDRVIASGAVDFRAADIASIEMVEFAPTLGGNEARFRGDQIGAGLAPGLLAAGFAGAPDVVRIDMGKATNVDLKDWTFKSWTPGGADNDLVLIVGDGSGEALRGSVQRDDIQGGAGSDTLNGNLGADKLDGGGKSGEVDFFEFNSALGKGNIDRVTGFEAGVDDFWLDNAIFVGLAAGNLAAGAFRIGTGAADASDRIIYDDFIGALYFDSDGKGGAAKKQFATVDAGLALDNLDFFVT